MSGEPDAVRITGDGIIFAHAGETISGEPDAEATGEPVEDPERVVHYHFPVHLEVHFVGEDTIQTAIDRRLEALASSFESL